MLVFNSGGEAIHSIIYVWVCEGSLSLEANFLDKLSIILAWPEINYLKGG
jgi:hypothetical protein